MNMAVPPRLAIPASNVNRVRNDGFSKNITICLPARAFLKSAGRAFITPARLKTAFTPAGPKSRVETTSAHQNPCGALAGALAALLRTCVFKVDSFFELLPFAGCNLYPAAIDGLMRM
jgi:hypothetical protein